MKQKIITFLRNNKKYLNYDGYIQFDKSVRNPDTSAPYQWIDGLQLDKYSGEVSVWLSTEKSENIHSIPLKNIERNEKLLGDILNHLNETITAQERKKTMNKNKKIYLFIVMISMLAMIIALVITIYEKKWYETLFVLDTLVWQIVAAMCIIEN